MSFIVQNAQIFIEMNEDFPKLLEDEIKTFC